MPPREEPRQFRPNTHRALLLDSRARAEVFERQVRVKGEADQGIEDGFEAVRSDPDRDWSPTLYWRSGAIAMVRICGPLEHHGGGWWFDSYDSIKERAKAALADPEVRAVVMRIDSPGGVANGMASTSETIRSAASKSGKRLYAFADEQICSAAFGLACAADEIWTPETGEIGSVGVILPVLDQTRANAKAGMRVELLTTGDRKGDGHPDKPLDDDVVAALQERVDAIGANFFQLVAKSRSMKTAAVEALEAGIFIGRDAVREGLADGVADWPEFLSIVQDSLDEPRQARTSTAQPPTRTKMSGKLLTLTKAKTEAEKALEAAGEIADPTKRAKALKSASVALSKATEVLAGYKFKKTVKVEEESDEGEDDDGSDDEDDDDEDDDDEPESTRGEDESEEDEADEEEDDMPAKKGKKAAASVSSFTKRYSAGALVSLAAEVTGERDLEAIFGALSAMKGQHAQLVADVAKIKSTARAEKVKAMVDQAIRNGKVARAEKASLIDAGMGSPKWLRANLAKRSPRFRTLESGGQGLDDHDTATAFSAGSDGLTALDRKAVEAHAAATGKTFAEALTAIRAFAQKEGV